MKVAVIEEHDEAVRLLLEKINSLNGAVSKVETYPNFQQFVQCLPRRGQPDLLFVDMNDLDAKARRFLKSGKLSSMLILTNALKLNGFQLQPKIDQISIRRQEETARELEMKDVEVEDPNTNLWQDRFLVKGNKKMLIVPSENISHFVSEGRLVFLRTKDTKKYVVQYTLDQLIHKLLDPRQYFRVNQSFIVAFRDIKELQQYTGSRLKVVLHQHIDENVIVSRENVNEFRRWLGE